MSILKTDYKDDILDTTVNEKRKYQMTNNSDGTVSFDDVTTYLQTGDVFGGADINATNAEINGKEGTVRYNSETDYVQLLCEGAWVDWKRGYLKSFDINSLPSSYWTETLNESNVMTWSTNPVSLTVICNPQIQQQYGTIMTVPNAINTNDYNCIKISGELIDGEPESNQLVISVLNEDDSLIFEKKIAGVRNSTVPFNITEAVPINKNIRLKIFITSAHATQLHNATANLNEIILTNM